MSEMSEEFGKSMAHLIELRIDGKKSKDFEHIGYQSRFFLFSMRAKNDQAKENGVPFVCTEKQLNFMKDIFRQMDSPAISSEREIKAAKRRIKTLEKDIRGYEADIAKTKIELAEEKAALKDLERTYKELIKKGTTNGKD